MAENNVIHLGENSPEHVAYKLLRTIAMAENVAIDEWGKADREWIITTYVECLKAVKTGNHRYSTK